METRSLTKASKESKAKMTRIYRQRPMLEIAQEEDEQMMSDPSSNEELKGQSLEEETGQFYPEVKLRKCKSKFKTGFYERFLLILLI